MLWEILIPTVRNNGRPFRLRHHRVWDNKVKSLANGLTIMKPTTKGEWVSKDGNLYVDRTIPVRIVCSEKVINMISDYTAKHYEQLAIMFYKISDHVVIKSYEK